MPKSKQEKSQQQVSQKKQQFRLIQQLQAQLRTLKRSQLTHKLPILAQQSKPTLKALLNKRVRKQQVPKPALAQRLLTLRAQAALKELRQDFQKVRPQLALPQRQVLLPPAPN
ncbi:hypothetical protein HMPREF1557_00798 [Streptococcus sobrinus W1703]|uniref:Uncharacterized protein n=1 Tax=Streptococcus sobrinus W1703 TaxID=1227275 RepID=U2JAA7_9STRE|nr:hypothetical protein HMPREF1557_00798 [Streptococcus sobrinus W1703]